MFRCPLLAQSGHQTTSRQCPLLGVKRTWRLHCEVSAYDLGCVKTQKFEKRRELFSQIKQKRTRSRIPAAIIAIQKNVHSIAVARRYVFTQPRPKADIAQTLHNDDFSGFHWRICLTLRGGLRRCTVDWQSVALSRTIYGLARKCLVFRIRIPQADSFERWHDLMYRN